MQTLITSISITNYKHKTYLKRLFKHFRCVFDGFEHTAYKFEQLCYSKKKWSSIFG
jgi:hypothetical protein